MAEAHPEKTPAEEIAALERLLEEKKQAFHAEGKQVPEREAFREVFRETYGRTSPAEPSGQSAHIPGSTHSSPAASAADPGSGAREEELESLVAVAFHKGIRAATDIAAKETPWLLDELHDRLQDRYYQHLLQMKKLKAL